MIKGLAGFNDDHHLCVYIAGNCSTVRLVGVLKHLFLLLLLSSLQVLTMQLEQFIIHRRFLRFFYLKPAVPSTFGIPLP
jgi:hypothetical protein